MAEDTFFNVQETACMVIDNCFRIVTAITSKAVMSEYDAIILGAGFAGIYQLYKLRSQGLRCLVIDQAGDVCGTWYWNLHPGAMSHTGAQCTRPLQLYSLADTARP
jgi:cation diffusion facilitator CzcD-associated flavoprotein CzcO